MRILWTLLRIVRLEMDRKSTSLERNNRVKRCRISQVDDSSCNAEERKEVDDVGFLASLQV
jgi:hypothetical protein